MALGARHDGRRSPARAHAHSFTGQALWTRMHNSFGYLTQQGYLGVRFPIVFGETGSFYTSVRHQTSGVRVRTLKQHFQAAMAWPTVPPGAPMTAAAAALLPGDVRACGPA